MSTHRLSLDPSLVTRLLGAVALFLILASVAGALSAHFTGEYRTEGLARLFNLDAEWNVPTFFSSVLLLVAALLLAVITALERRRSPALALHWAILACGFLTMAADEVISLHEKLIRPTARLLGGEGLGFFYFAWIVPAIVLLAGLALFYLRFLLRLPPADRRRFVLAGALYVGGVIGMELIAGRHVEMHGYHNLTYSLLATVEESLEMAGIVVFIEALLLYLAEHHREVRIGIGTAAAGADAG